MSTKIDAVQDETQYWELGYAMLEVLVMELNEALKENGVTDAAQRQAICDHFAFGTGNFFDQYWMEVNGQKWYPMICFSPKFLDLNVTIEEIGTVQFPCGFEYHGGAMEVSAEYFGDQGEQLSGVRIGCISEE